MPIQHRNHAAMGGALRSQIAQYQPQGGEPIPPAAGVGGAPHPSGLPVGGHPTPPPLEVFGGAVHPQPPAPPPLDVFGGVVHPITQRPPVSGLPVGRSPLPPIHGPIAIQGGDLRPGGAPQGNPQQQAMLGAFGGLRG